MIQATYVALVALVASVASVALVVLVALVALMDLLPIPDICHFSPPSQFLSKCCSKQKRINRAKTDFAKISVNRHKTYFTTKTE